MSPTRRLVVLLAAVGALAAAAWWLPLGSLPDQLGRLGPLAPVLGVLVGALLLVALVPRTPVSLACGVLFGPWLGAACALAAAIIAAALTFAAGRALGRDFVAGHSGPRFARVEAWIAREGLLAVAAVRSLPIGPYGFAGYAYGASGVRVRDYALGTIVAALPSSVSYALLGAAVAGGGRFNPLTIVPIAAGLVLSAALVVRARRASRARAAAAAPPPAVLVAAGAPRD